MLHISEVSPRTAEAVMERSTEFDPCDWYHRCIADAAVILCSVKKPDATYITQYASGTTYWWHRTGTISVTTGGVVL